MYRFEDEIARALSDGVFPSAALLVSRGEEILYRNFFGTGEKTIFDIASLTKPVATATLALLARMEGKLTLDSTIVNLLPEFDAEEKRKISVRHLLKHTSGLPAWRPYFDEVARQRPDLFGKRVCAELYIQKIGQESLEVPVAYQRIYSDLGFIVLGVVMERVLGNPLDRLFRDRISEPLGLKNTFYLPVDPPETHSFPREQFAPTGDSPCRKRTLQGEVNDDNAYAVGGVAGHAGLFSTVDDLHRFLVEIDRAITGTGALIPQDQAQEFIGAQVKVKLGWDTPTPPNSQSGRYFGAHTIGHLGFTGCSFWIDFTQKFHVILLTNRVHPHPKNEKIREIRPVIHDLVYEELISAGSPSH